MTVNFVNLLARKYLEFQLPTQTMQISSYDHKRLHNRTKTNSNQYHVINNLQCKCNEGKLLFNNCISSKCHHQAYPVFRAIAKETPVVIITAV